MPVVTTVTGVQYSGLWTRSQQFQAQGAGTWPIAPLSAGLWGWGRNGSGQLGLGNTTYYSSPKAVGSLTNWNNVSPFTYSAAAIKSDGTLWTWGYNDYGQLGLGNSGVTYSSPKQVGALTNWSTVSGGGRFCAAIKTDGTLWAWGNNGSGQLGSGNTTLYSSPKQVGSLTNWLYIASGYSFVLAIKTNGTLWSWGQNVYGQLGFGNTTNYSSPKQVGALTSWAAIASGGAHSLAIKTDGTIWSWGRNLYGQLGLGNTTYYSSPKQIGSLTSWLKLGVSGTSDSSASIKTDGTLWMWGRNNFGQLGLGNSGTYTHRSSPVQVGALTDWLTVSSGQYQTGALKTNGTAWSWGSNSGGQLGLGNTTYYSSPKQIGSSTNWVSLKTSGQNMLALQQ
jgi:alpha-tubulin suppressor-like RCC1 family protein